VKPFITVISEYAGVDGSDSSSSSVFAHVSLDVVQNDLELVLGCNVVDRNAIRAAVSDETRYTFLLRVKTHLFSLISKYS
jgi:hypothetical protein